MAGWTWPSVPVARELILCSPAAALGLTRSGQGRLLYRATSPDDMAGTAAPGSRLFF